MNRCLYSCRLQHLGHRASVPYRPAICRPSSSSVDNTSLCGICVRRQRRLYSSIQPKPLPRALPLQDYVLAKKPKVPIFTWMQKWMRPWAGWLERYLPPELRRGPGAPSEWEHEASGDVLARARDIIDILRFARNARGNPLTYLGFSEGRWSAVYNHLTTLLDAADSVRQECVVPRPLSNLDWGSGAGLTIDQLTAHRGASTRKPVQTDHDSNAAIDLDNLTNRPFGNDLAASFTGETLLTLGEIVAQAADEPPEKAKIAMSYVYRILARLHHLGMIPDKIYQYAPPDDNETIFRPPSMHLLSTHIMMILSDAAWVEHEPQVIAQGEESPFLPFKLGTRELGPEIWLEFILWCCVEYEVKDAIALLKQAKSRQGDAAWHFRSWRPLLQNGDIVWNTKIDSEETWRHPDNDVSRPSPSQRSAAFHGLGKRTISTEVAASLIAMRINNLYLGLAWGGVASRDTISDIRFLREITNQGRESNLEPTTKSINVLAVRVLESGGIDPLHDPYTFEAFLNAHPWIVPPWVSGRLDWEQLGCLSESQIYDETSAFAGMMEYNIDTYATRAQTTLAIRTFERLLGVIDESKRQNINKSFELINQPEMPVPFFNSRYPAAPEMLASCMPQMSNTTFAKLLDLARSSQQYTFAEWLLSSEDIDGPAIPISAYGDQALAPSLLRLATETGNVQLYEQVVQSLVQPLSLNTLRALLNARIALGEWDSVVDIFAYIRDYRAKAWGFSNVSALAVAILRMGQSIRQSNNAGKSPPPGTDYSLARAKDILLRLLNGEFGTPHHIRVDNYYPLAIQGFYQLFNSIPGPLKEVASQVNSSSSSSNRLNHATFPILPTEPFNDIISAVVDIHGSAGGKYLWNRWIVERPTLEDIRRHEGGVSRMLIKEERDISKGNPNFDEKWFRKLHSKMAIPNFHTVRIIARKALQEYAAEGRRRGREGEGEGEPEATTATAPDTGTITNTEPPTNPPPTDNDNDNNNNPVTHPLIQTNDTPTTVLDFCVRRFKNLNASVKQIDLETDGHMARMRAAGRILERPRRKAYNRDGYAPR